MEKVDREPQATIPSLRSLLSVHHSSPGANEGPQSKMHDFGHYSPACMVLLAVFMRECPSYPGCIIYFLLPFRWACVHSSQKDLEPEKLVILIMALDLIFNVPHLSLMDEICVISVLDLCVDVCSTAV